jgi:hypothetical protein
MTSSTLHRTFRLCLEPTAGQAQALAQFAGGGAGSGTGRWPRCSGTTKSKKRDRARFRIPQRVKVVGNGVQVPKIGRVRLRLSQPVVGTTKSATVKQDACGHWFVTLVAEREVPVVKLADLATDPASAPAAGSAGAPIPEIAGPREENLVDVARLLVARRGDPVRIEGVSDPADPDRDLYEAGALLPGPHATLAGPTFAEWLDSTS